jgi:hypothetical protein
MMFRRWVFLMTLIFSRRALLPLSYNPELLMTSSPCAAFMT